MDRNPINELPDETPMMASHTKTGAEAEPLAEWERELLEGQKEEPKADAPAAEKATEKAPAKAAAKPVAEKKAPAKKAPAKTAEKKDEK